MKVRRCSRLKELGYSNLQACAKLWSGKASRKWRVLHFPPFWPPQGTPLPVCLLGRQSCPRKAALHLPASDTAASSSSDPGRSGSSGDGRGDEHNVMSKGVWRDSRARRPRRYEPRLPATRWTARSVDAHTSSATFPGASTGLQLQSRLPPTFEQPPPLSFKEQPPLPFGRTSQHPSSPL